MDYERTVGWWVRIVRRKKLHSQFFADSQWGGCRKAELAARAWRDQQLAKLPAPEAPGTKVGGPETKVRINNTSGVPGVYRYLKHCTRRTPLHVRYMPYWAAGWYEKGEKKEVCFSVYRYGERQAKRKAKAARRQAEERLSQVA